MLKIRLIPLLNNNYEYDEAEGGDRSRLDKTKFRSIVEITTYVISLVTTDSKKSR